MISFQHESLVLVEIENGLFTDGKIIGSKTDLNDLQKVRYLVQTDLGIYVVNEKRIRKICRHCSRYGEKLR